MFEKILKSQLLSEQHFFFVKPMDTEENQPGCNHCCRRKYAKERKVVHGTFEQLFHR